MAEAKIIRKNVTGSGSGAANSNNDQNHNKTTPMKEKAKEKIRKQMKGPLPSLKEAQQLKKEKVRVRKGQATKPSKAAPIQKGKSYRSSLDRNLKEKDPNSKEVLIKKYVKDTKAGGRSKRSEFHRRKILI